MTTDMIILVLCVAILVKLALRALWREVWRVYWDNLMEDAPEYEIVERQHVPQSIVVQDQFIRSPYLS